MKNLIVAGIVLTLLLLTLIVSKKNKQTSDIYLIFYLCFATLMQAYFYLETFNVVQNSYWMLLGRGGYLLDAPLIFLYVYSILTSKKLSAKLFAILILPFAAFFFHFLYYYFFVFDNVHLSIQSGLLVIDKNISFSWLLFSLLFLIIGPAYLAWFYFLLVKYKKGLKAISNQDSVQLHWLYLIFYLQFFMMVLLIPLSAVNVGTGWVSTDVLQMIIQAGNVIFFFILGYYGFKHTNVFVDNHDEETSSQASKKSGYHRSGLSDVQANEYHRQLLILMENQKPYLNGELKASELAELLGISVNHLSQVLNQIQKQNFFDFVNSYRISHVIRKMEDPKFSHNTLLSMALDSGFNSKTSFNTVFKKVMQQTPSYYYKAIKKKSGSNL